MAKLVSSSCTLVLVATLILSFSIFSISVPEECIYTIYVSTGSDPNSGTDSTISLTLFDEARYGIRIRNLASFYGLMGPGHKYFQHGNVDVFSGKGPCLTGPICEMNLTSDGSGTFRSWYCNFVEVTTARLHRPCDQKSFTVEQWLIWSGVRTAIRNDCSHKPATDTSNLSKLSVI